MGRTYGFELECVCDELRAAAEFAARWPREPDGFSTPHGTVSLVLDRSVRARRVGCNLEVRSPVYPDPQFAVDSFEVIAGVLQGAGARRNTRCGLHLHCRIPYLDCGVDGAQSATNPDVRDRADWGQARAVAVAMRWLAVQQAFWMALRPSQVRSRHRWAAPWTKADVLAILTCPDHWCADQFRYRDLNVGSLVKHGTLELRLNPATLDPSEFAGRLEAFEAWCATLDDESEQVDVEATVWRQRIRGVRGKVDAFKQSLRAACAVIPQSSPTVGD